jgi:hypothetical protein
MISSKIELDQRAFNQLEAALQRMPLEYRAPFLLQAQKSSLKPVVKAAKAQSRNMTQSPTLAQSIRWEKGRYVKKTGGAYSVIQHRDKLYNRTRKLGKYVLPHKSNYAKIERFIINGTASGVRTVGVRKRKDRAGAVYMQKVSNPKKGFVVAMGAGKWGRVKKIRYPGSQHNDYFDVAFTEQMANSERKFAVEVFDQLDKFKRKNGLI